VPINSNGTTQIHPNNRAKSSSPKHRQPVPFASNNQHDHSEFHDAILAACEGLERPQWNKRGYATIQTAEAKKRQMSIPATRQDKIDSIRDKEKFSTDLNVDALSVNVQSLGNIKELPLLEALSEKTLSKLRAFRYSVASGPDDSSTPQASDRSILHEYGRSGHSVARSPMQDTEDEFQVDDDIFNDSFTDYERQYIEAGLTEPSPGDANSDCMTIGSYPEPKSTPRHNLQRYENSSNPEFRKSPSAGSFAIPRKLSARRPRKPESKSGPQSIMLEESIPPTLFVPPIKPFIRSKPRELVPPSSLIPSLAVSRRIVTIFRVAEIHRLVANLSHDLPLRLELYAIVIASNRNTYTKTQIFQFGDLFFPHRPPYVHGTYTAYNLCELSDRDSAPFLGKEDGKKICRAIVELRKYGLDRGDDPVGSIPLCGINAGAGMGGYAMEVDVLNIWEATWDDVKYVKGIVDA